MKHHEPRSTIEQAGVECLPHHKKKHKHHANNKHHKTSPKALA
jgi:hypothetical protein